MNLAQSLTYEGSISTFPWPFGGTFSQEDIEQKERDENDRKVLFVLASGNSTTVRAIAADRDMTKEAVDASLRRLLRAGRVTRATAIKPYLWRLA